MSARSTFASPIVLAGRCWGVAIEPTIRETPRKWSGDVEPLVRLGDVLCDGRAGRLEGHLAQQGRREPMQIPAIVSVTQCAAR